MKVEVKVTQEHIDKGKQEDGDCCPIALAFKALGFDGVSVDDETCVAHRGSFLYVFDLPSEARNFMWDFDMWDNLPVRPFTFEAETPE